MSTDSTDTDFGTWIEDTFGAGFPVRLEESLVHYRDRVWVSPGLRDSFRSLQVPMTPAFAEPPGDYCMAGHWGHGVNSWAFYLIERRGAHKVFFRLPYGGAYGDPSRDAARAVRFLASYQSFRERWLSRLAEYDLLHEMGKGNARLVLEGGSDLGMDDPPAADADGFFERLEALLAADR
jgi:hypothetical protein